MWKKNDSDEPGRFDIVSDQNHSFGERTRILRDRETGVNYVYHWAGTAGGLTTLLNADGTPVVTES